LVDSPCDRRPAPLKSLPPPRDAGKSDGCVQSSVYPALCTAHAPRVGSEYLSKAVPPRLEMSPLRATCAAIGYMRQDRWVEIDIRELSDLSLKVTFRGYRYIELCVNPVHSYTRAPLFPGSSGSKLGCLRLCRALIFFLPMLNT
jgi:hypothetical protein